MGVNDAQEMLDAAKEQAILDEREIASLKRQLAVAERDLALYERAVASVRDAGSDADEIVGVLYDLDTALAQAQEIQQ